LLESLTITRWDTKTASSMSACWRHRGHSQDGKGGSFREICSTVKRGTSAFPVAAAVTMFRFGGALPQDISPTAPAVKRVSRSDAPVRDLSLPVMCASCACLESMMVL